MKTKHTFWLVCFMLAGCTLLTPKYHDLKSRHVNKILKHDSLEFSKEAWLHGNPARRGLMLASLLRSYSFLEMNNDEVFELLGVSNCYLDYEDEPCYNIQYGDELYHFAFWVNHSDKPGKIIGILFFD